LQGKPLALPSSLSTAFLLAAIFAHAVHGAVDFLQFRFLADFLTAVFLSSHDILLILDFGSQKKNDLKVLQPLRSSVGSLKDDWRVLSTAQLSVTHGIVVKEINA
jgi:hypothetical protein